jgi:HAD superfamily hydrolase (TIGR01490 family)
VAGRIAFFDLDKTLISRNSATLWLRYEFEAGRIPLGRALQAAGWVLRYSLGVADMHEPIRRAVAQIRGEPEAEIRARTERFYAERVRAIYRPGALDAVRGHQDAGDRVLLLTSASNYLSEPVVAELRLDGYVCNRLVVDADGRFTGTAVEPLCFGAGKVTLAERYLRSVGATLADTIFYSDSHSDLPMLEAAGRAVVVHPDPRLRRVARQRGWETVDWGRPGRTPAPAHALSSRP